MTYSVLGGSSQSSLATGCSGYKVRYLSSSKSGAWKIPEELNVFGPRGILEKLDVSGEGQQ